MGVGKKRRVHTSVVEVLKVLTKREGGDNGGGY